MSFSEEEILAEVERRKKRALLYIERLRPELEFLCPGLAYFQSQHQILERAMQAQIPERPVQISSSSGGYGSWAILKVNGLVYRLSYPNHRTFAVNVGCDEEDLKCVLSVYEDEVKAFIEGNWDAAILDAAKRMKLWQIEASKIYEAENRKRELRSLATNFGLIEQPKPPREQPKMAREWNHDWIGRLWPLIPIGVVLFLLWVAYREAQRLYPH
jgi:hypothetical protein